MRPRNPGRGWAGDLRPDPSGDRIGALVAPGTPAYDAGLEQDDQITEVDGKGITTLRQFLDAVGGHKPGDQLRVSFTNRGGPTTATMTLKADPALETLLVEDTGGAPTPAQQAFRDAWLGSQQKK